MDEAGVRGKGRADRSVLLWRGVSGNNTAVLVGDFEAKGGTGNGTVRSRSTFLVGDLEGNLGEDGVPGNERADNDALGEADAKVLVRDETLVGMTRRGRLASGIWGTGFTPE